MDNPEHQIDFIRESTNSDDPSLFNLISDWNHTIATSHNTSKNLTHSINELLISLQTTVSSVQQTLTEPPTHSFSHQSFLRNRAAILTRLEELQTTLRQAQEKVSGLRTELNETLEEVARKEALFQKQRTHLSLVVGRVGEVKKSGQSQSSELEALLQEVIHGQQQKEASLQLFRETANNKRKTYEQELASLQQERTVVSSQLSQLNERQQTVLAKILAECLSTEQMLKQEEPSLLALQTQFEQEHASWLAGRKTAESSHKLLKNLQDVFLHHSQELKAIQAERDSEQRELEDELGKEIEARNNAEKDVEEEVISLRQIEEMLGQEKEVLHQTELRLRDAQLVGDDLKDELATWKDKVRAKSIQLFQTLDGKTKPIIKN
eukprot:TRINITY_DN18155_c0_g1_i1.p2 TRINITY_DN18155_c0_g1~~TRINITY_DN18155_c0_g1_i1.p2  ORF type:complete len:379 (+),score=90.95 TRINITY_DN18155_c0_g1_i1:1585-2721(+)